MFGIFFAHSFIFTKTLEIWKIVYYHWYFIPCSTHNGLDFFAGCAVHHGHFKKVPMKGVRRLLKRSSYPGACIIWMTKEILPETETFSQLMTNLEDSDSALQWFFAKLLFSIFLSFHHIPSLYPVDVSWISWAAILVTKEFSECAQSQTAELNIFPLNI